MISAVIITDNWDEKMKRCVKSVEWCGEIVVVEDLNIVSGIKYQVLGINNKIKVFGRRLSNDFAQQRNYGLKKAKEEWVLFVDSDEEVSRELRKEITAKTQNITCLAGRQAIAKKCVGYYLKREDCFMGRWLRHGEAEEIKLLRLAKKNSGRWRGCVHETWEIEGPTALLENPLHHYPHPTIKEFLGKINSYTDIVAQSWKEEGRKIHGWEIVFFPLGKFLQNYLWKLGFLDGFPGLVMAVMMSFHSFLARAKYYLEAC